MMEKSIFLFLMGHAGDSPFYFLSFAIARIFSASSRTAVFARLSDETRETGIAVRSACSIALSSGITAIGRPIPVSIGAVPPRNG